MWTFQNCSLAAAAPGGAGGALFVWEASWQKHGCLKKQTATMHANRRRQ
jgi:hypothetical protein